MRASPSHGYRICAIASAVILLSACAHAPATDETAATADGRTAQAPTAAACTPEAQVCWGGYGAELKQVLDPFANNWSIDEARLTDEIVLFRMGMRRYYAGGAGEARVTLDRRARVLVRAGGFSGYEIVEYTESLDSTVFGAKRTAEAVIRLLRPPA